jgi:hypothetical protein
MPDPLNYQNLSNHDLLVQYNKEMVSIDTAKNTIGDYAIAGTAATVSAAGVNHLVKKITSSVKEPGAFTKAIGSVNSRSYISGHQEK